MASPGERNVAVTNVKKMDLPVAPGTRSAAAMVKETPVTWAPKEACVKIAPEATPADARVSWSVCTVMPVELPAVAAPIVTPFRVMVKAVAVVMTMAVPVGWAEVAVMEPIDVVPAALAVGVADVAKNPDG